MTLAVSLPPDTEAKLAAKAKSMGLDTPTYAARILEAAAIRPPLDEILKPIRRKFAESGMSEDEAAARYEAEKHAARAAKRSRPFDE
jgi:hypothetical protein